MFGNSVTLESRKHLMKWKEVQLCPSPGTEHLLSLPLVSTGFKSGGTLYSTHLITPPMDIHTQCCKFHLAVLLHAVIFHEPSN